MIEIKYKPLSVNEAWKGQRFKTDKYKKYEKDVLFLLPKISLPKPPYKIYLEFGLSSSLSDWDNPIKPLQDILQLKYNFNDKDIFKAEVLKVKVEKGNEYFKFEFSSIENR